jgi:hypothetical protein
MAKTQPLESDAREQLRREVTPDSYAKVRELRIAHSKAEDARDLQGLIDTLAVDCVYEIIPTGQRWEGHAVAPRVHWSYLSTATAPTALRCRISISE